MTTQNETDETPEPSDLTTGADATMVAMRDLAAQKGIALPGMEGAAPGPGPGDDEPGEGDGDEAALSPVEREAAQAQAQAQPAPAAAKPVPVPAATPAAEEPPKDMREYLAKLAAKSRRIVELEQGTRDLVDFDKLMKSGQVVQALHQRYGLTAAEFARRSLDLPELPGQAKQDAGVDLSGLPPEMQKALGPVLQKVSALEQQNADLLKRAQTADQQQQTAAQAAQREKQVGLVSNYLGTKADAFPLVNDLGLHAQVYDRVCAHVNTHGQFETDREAAQVLEHIAAEVEEAEVARITAMLEKPRAKQFLLRALGAQKEAKPARQETRAQPGRSNGAAPAVPNSLASQRASRGRPSGWDALTIDQQLARTAELAVTREAAG